MRRRTVAVLGLLGAIWWLRSDDDALGVATERPQAGVLPEGSFTMMYGPRDTRRILEVNYYLDRLRDMPLRTTKDVRLVGTRSGSAVGFIDGKKLALALLADDGSFRDVSMWGKNARQLCDGAASNDHRFGVGWLESDGRVWFVHGPMERTLADATAAIASPEPASITWCGIASAEQNIALLWRDGSRLLMNFCTRKQCTSLVVKVPIEARDTLLAYGCLRDSCLFATRDKHGNTQLHRVTAKGKAITKTLEHATASTAVSIVGVSGDAFAVGYTAKDDNATVQRVTTALAFTKSVVLPDHPGAPTLAAWTNGMVLAVFPAGEAKTVDLRP